MAQPLKKKEARSNTDKLSALREFKNKNGLSSTVEKEPQWLILPEAFQKATRLPGIPCGYCSRIRGKSNTGKSTLKLEIIKAAQRQGILPVVFELENNFAWKHAKEIGVDVSEAIDEETGEVIYGPADNMLYYDTATLYEKYGKFDHEHGKWLTKPNRETYVIEDVAMCIKDLIRAQRNGELPMDMIFVIDSIGVGDCYRAAVNNSSNNMWYAGAVSVAFLNAWKETCKPPWSAMFSPSVRLPFACTPGATSILSKKLTITCARSSNFLASSSVHQSFRLPSLSY